MDAQRGPLFGAERGTSRLSALSHRQLLVPRAVQQFFRNLRDFACRERLKSRGAHEHCDLVDHVACSPSARASMVRHRVGPCMLNFIGRRRSGVAHIRHRVLSQVVRLQAMQDGGLRAGYEVGPGPLRSPCLPSAGSIRKCAL